MGELCLKMATQNLPEKHRLVPPQLEMDIPAVCIKGLQGALLSTLGLIGP